LASLEQRHRPLDVKLRCTELPPEHGVDETPDQLPGADQGRVYLTVDLDFSARWDLLEDRRFKKVDAGEYVALRLGAGRAGGASRDSDDPFPLAELDEAVIGSRLRGCHHHGRQGSGIAMLPQDRIEITVAHEITVY